MSVRLHKENIKINEVICSEYSEVTAAGDVIVPDINPDVLKVLRINARTYVTQKTVQQDRAYIQGTIKLNILYIPESFECGKIKVINTSLDFSCFADAKGAKPGMCISAEAECTGITDNLINSRKLNISCTVGINIKICTQSNEEIAVSAPEDEGLELKCSKLRLINSTQDTDKEFVVSERLILPAGKPPISEILKFGAHAASTELRLTDGKAVIKGELKLSVLYSCQEEDGDGIEFFEYTIPFTEVFDVSGIKEGMEGEAEFIIKDVSFRIEDGEAGENTCVCADILIGAQIKGSEIMEISVIEDAYSTDAMINTEKKCYNFEQLLDSGCVQIPQKELLTIPDYLPEIRKICDISATPSVTDVSISDGCAVVKGIINVNMLYITRSSELPVAGFDKVFEFSHSFDLTSPVEIENSICEAKILNEHLSYTLSGERSLELRLINSLCIKCISSGKTEIIDSIEESEEPLLALPTVIIYFVQPDDSPWSIAKHFHTSWDKIVADNNLSSSGVKTGQKLLIFR